MASLGRDVRPVDVRHHALIVSEDVGPEALSAVAVREEHGRTKKDERSGVGSWRSDLETLITSPCQLIRRESHQLISALIIVSRVVVGVVERSMEEREGGGGRER